MSASAKNKENVSEHKKSSKQSKQLKSRLLLKEFFPLKNQGLQHLNRSLDMSEVTIKTSTKRQETKSTNKRIRSKNTSECSLKQEQKTRKVIPIPFDKSLFKRPLSEKTIKPKNSRKQSEYVSYLVQAQRKAMNSLASIDKSQLSNCHQIQRLDQFKNEQIHQLRSQMQGLKHRFERLESEHTINQKETIITLQDVNDKDHATIDLGILGNKKAEIKTVTDSQLIFKTIEVQKKPEKDVAEKYGSIITQYEKMFAFYKERLEVCETDFETEKQREKAAQQQNQKLKLIVESKENQLRRKQRIFQVEKNELKSEISIFEKSLNKKNKELISKNEQLLLMESDLKTKEQQLFLLKTREKYESFEVQNEKKTMIEKFTRELREKQEILERKEQIMRSEIQQIEKRMSEEMENLKEKLSVQKRKNKQTERVVQNEREIRQSQEKQIRALKQSVQDFQKTYDGQNNDLKSELSTVKVKLTEIEGLWVQKQGQYMKQIEKNEENHLAQVKSLREMIKYMENKLSEQEIISKSENAKLKSDISQLESKVSSLSEQVSSKSNQLNRISLKTSSQIKEKTTEIQKLKNILHQFTQEVKLIKSEITQNQTYILKIQAERDHLHLTLQKQRQSFSQQKSLILRNQHLSVAQERQHLIRKHCKTQEQLQASQKLLQQKLSEIAHFTTLASKHDHESQILVKEIQHQKEQLSKQVQFFSAQVQLLQQDKQAILSEKQQLLTKVWKLNEIITGNYDLALKIKQRHNTQILNKDNAVIETLRQVEKVKAQKNLLEKTLEEKSSQIQILRQQIISLSEEGQIKLQSIKDMHEAKLFNWKSEIEALQNVILQKTQQIEHLAGIIDSKNSQISQKEHSNNKLLEKLEDQQQKIRRLQNTISQNNQTISIIKAQNKQLSVQLETITEELFCLSSRYEEAQSTQRQITERKTQEISQIYQVCEENKREIIESMRTKIDQLAEEIQQSQLKSKQKDQRISQLQKELETVQSLKSQIQDLKKKLLQSALASKGKITEMQKLEEKSSKILKELQNSQKYAKSYEQKIAALENKIKEMNEKMSQKDFSTEKLMAELSQNKQKQTNLLQKITILKQENQSIISTYNYQLEQRKQIIEDLMKEKRQLYQKLNGDSF